jgi:DNA-directed RNA polymerase specialized sigma24 family protein
MPVDAKRKAARQAVRAAQKQFERESDAANKARRKAFTQAQKEGLTLREIGEEVGLHHTRVGQIIRGQ